MTNNRKYKVFSTAWHTMHFYDLFNALKDDAKFYLVHNTNRIWHEDYRPLPENVEYVPYYEKGKYDFAILDVDQQLVNPDIGKRSLYLEMRNLTNGIPQVVINHGTPVYPEFLKIESMTDEDTENSCRREIKKIVGDRPMIVNSYEAASEREWGWGWPIIHGMNKDDWWDLPKEPRIFSALSPGGCDAYYNREMMNEVFNILEKKYNKKIFWAKVNIDTGGNFDKYREFLGRSLIYFDPSFRTPMNRARTEAMLSGCCIMQVEGAHDLERFAKPNENMILVPNDAEIIARTLDELTDKKYKWCVKIGKEGKKMAQEKFNVERFRQDWLRFIREKLNL